MIRLFRRRKVKRQFYVTTPDELDDMMSRLYANEIRADYLHVEEIHWPLDKN